LRLVSVGSDRVAPRDAAAYSRWILDAGNPYLGWFLGGPARALEIISEWRSRSRNSSEVSLARATALLEGERVLGKIGLLPEYRGQGFGSFLPDAFISASVEKGYDTLRLDVCADNGAAIRLYRRRGFEAELAPLGVCHVAMTLTKGSS
jgi:GNAT superfamily N-acetyltransferase